MGSGTWTKDEYLSYTSCAYTTAAVDAVSGTFDSSSVSVSDIYKSQSLNQALDPNGVIRECRDSEEHPNTVPIIIALDVTGSMGKAAVEVAASLNKIMTNLYEKIDDVEFLFMGIGDLEYDRCPVQATQFESDVRIAEQMDKIYFEFGGGGNNFESYTAAWWFGVNHTDLDCWKRNKKGIIITLGDERLNPYLPVGKSKTRHGSDVNTVFGDTVQENIKTDNLYDIVTEKYDVYHIHVEHSSYVDNGIDDSWKILGDNFKRATLNQIPDTISDIIINAINNEDCVSVGTNLNDNGEIVW